MAYKFNPLLSVGLDDAGEGGAGSTPGGSDTQIQYNSSGTFAGSADLTWDDTAKELGVGGDINLDDGGTYATTLQLITPTANRTISFPDATGTVALVGGSSGQLIYNNAGAYAGAQSTSVGASGDITLSLAGAASTPPVSLTGTWFTGGTSTTTKPQFLIEPTGTTSTAWSTSGTGLGINAASGFGGNLLDLQVNGTSKFNVSANGNIVNTTSGSAAAPSIGIGSAGVGFYRSVDTVYYVTAGSAHRFGIGNSGAELTPVGLVAWSSTTSQASGPKDLALARDQANVLAVTNGSTGTGYIKQVPVAVSALPSAATVGAGTRGFVNDATATTFASTVTGGGANTVPVYSDGTNWIIG